MAIEAIDTTLGFFEEVPTLIDVYTPGISVKLGGLENPKESSLKLEADICRSIYPVQNFFGGDFSSAALVCRYRYCKFGSYLYFGITASSCVDGQQSLELMGLRNKNIRLTILDSSQYIDTPGITLFCFSSRDDFAVRKIAEESPNNESLKRIFAGFQRNSKFDWDDIENEYADYYPISESVQRLYSTEALLSSHKTYAYHGSEVSWAHSAEDFLCAEDIRILSGLPLKHILPGGVVLNTQGQIEGLVSECWRQDIAPITDLSKNADAINECIREAIAKDLVQSIAKSIGTESVK